MPISISPWTMPPRATSPTKTSAPSSASVSVRRRCLGGELLLARVHELGAPAVDHAGLVAEHDVLLPHAELQPEAQAAERRRAGAGEDDARRLDALVRQGKGVEQRGAGDDRRAVLVVVEDRIDIDSFKRRSISKHSGARMSSRLMPPNVGSSSCTVRTISSGSRWRARGRTRRCRRSA
jgi:hypothetical protein